MHRPTSCYSRHTSPSSPDSFVCSSKLHLNVHKISGSRYPSRYSDSPRAGRSGDRIPVGMFSAPFQTPWDPLSFLCSGYRVSLPRVKRPGRGVDHPPSSKAEVKERVELNLYSPSGPSWLVLGWPLPLTSLIQGVPGGMDKTSGECSLCWTIPI